MKRIIISIIIIAIITVFMTIVIINGQQNIETAMSSLPEPEPEPEQKYTEPMYGVFKTKEEYEEWLKAQAAEIKHEMSPEMKEAWRKLFEMAEESQQQQVEIHQRAVNRAKRYVATSARRYTEEEMDNIIKYFEQKEYEQLYLEEQR